MGILTNLVGFAQDRENQQFSQKLNMLQSLVQQPGISDQGREFLIDQIASLAPKSAGLKDIGGLFKGLFKKQKQQHQQQRLLQQFQQQFGAPMQTVQMPMSAGQQETPQPAAPPGSMQELQQLPMTRQPATAPMDVPVRPSMMLSPEAQFRRELDQKSQLLEQENKFKEIYQKWADDEKTKADLDRGQKEFDQQKRQYEALTALDPKTGKPMYTPNQAATMVYGKGFPQEIAEGEPTGLPRDLTWAHTVVNAPPGTYPPAVVQAAKDYIAKEDKTGGLTGTLGEMANAQEIIDNPGKHTLSQVKAAKDFLAKANRPPSTTINLGEAKKNAKDILEGMQRGDIPPNLSGYGMGQLRGELLAEAARQKVPLAQMELDWLATSQFYRTLNGAQQTRLRQATEFSTESLNLLSNPDTKQQGADLIGQLRRFIPRSKFPILNKAALTAAKQGVFGDAAASAARQVDSQITDLQSELATVYQGGNSPTDQKIGRAKQILDSDWSENTLRDAVDLSRTNLGLRLNSIRNVGVGGPTGGGMYAPTPAPPTPTPLPVNRAAQPPASTKAPKTADGFIRNPQ